MQVLSNRFLGLLALLFSLVILGVAATRLSDKEEDMLNQARSPYQSPIYENAGHAWQTWTLYPKLQDYSHIPDFERDALEMAYRKGAMHISDTMDDNDIRNSAWRSGSNSGSKLARDGHIYFYSIVPPRSYMGLQMGLPEKNRVASLLWKHDPGTGQTKLIHVDELQHYKNLQWDMDKLEDILRHH